MNKIAKALKNRAPSSVDKYKQMVDQDRRESTDTTDSYELPQDVVDVGNKALESGRSFESEVKMQDFMKATPEEKKAILEEEHKKRIRALRERMLKEQDPQKRKKLNESILNEAGKARGME